MDSRGSIRRSERSLNWIPLDGGYVGSIPARGTAHESTYQGSMVGACGDAMKIVIMSGCSGSGKSTLAAAFSGKVDKATIVSADNWFIDATGTYCFDVTQLGKAHGACLQAFIETVRDNRDDLVIVDNTNTSSEEIAPYYAIAQAYGVEVELVTVLCDPEKAAMRNKHGVPQSACKRMDAAIRNRKLPPFWAMKLTTV